jgi:hypothetical protein
MSGVLCLSKLEYIYIKKMNVCGILVSSMKWIMRNVLSVFILLTCICSFPYVIHNNMRQLRHQIQENYVAVEDKVMIVTRLVNVLDAPVLEPVAGRVRGSQIRFLLNQIAARVTVQRRCRRWGRVIAVRGGTADTTIRRGMQFAHPNQPILSINKTLTCGGNWLMV